MNQSRPGANDGIRRPLPNNGTRRKLPKDGIRRTLPRDGIVVRFFFAFICSVELQINNERIITERTTKKVNIIL